MTDNVKHPAHYAAHASGVECIEIAQHLGFNLGNAFKYMFRHQYKGKPVEDMQKCQEYIEIEQRYRAQFGRVIRDHPEALDDPIYKHIIDRYYAWDKHETNNLLKDIARGIIELRYTPIPDFDWILSKIYIYITEELEKL